MNIPTGFNTHQGATDLITWAAYLDQVEQAMHEFEVALSQRSVTDLHFIPPPAGEPPEELRRRTGELYRWMTELEFRARFVREEIRSEFARLPRGRGASDGSKSSWNYGSALDING
jgi:hypothetical protein